MVLSSKGPAVQGVGGTASSGANDMAVGDSGETHETGEFWLKYGLYDAMRSLDWRRYSCKSAWLASAFLTAVLALDRSHCSFFLSLRVRPRSCHSDSPLSLLSSFLYSMLSVPWDFASSEV